MQDKPSMPFRVNLTSSILLLCFATCSSAFVNSPFSPKCTFKQVKKCATSSLASRRSANVVLAAGTRMSVNVRVEKDFDAVGKALCEIVVTEAARALNSDKQSFAFAISGGSMLKMLKFLNGESSIDWSRCVMAHVSHRCVPINDDASTYHKAQGPFLKSWEDQGLKVITLGGTTDAHMEADNYEKALFSLPTSVLPRNEAGLPIFDLCLIGVGTDGHVGSLYPKLPELDSTRAVVPIIEPGKPTKISFSLDTMKASKVSVIACAGKSEKAPLGKAEAMVRGIEGENETKQTFPASYLRHSSTWLLDQDSACLLKNKGK